MNIQVEASICLCNFSRLGICLEVTDRHPIELCTGAIICDIRQPLLQFKRRQNFYQVRLGESAPTPRIQDHRLSTTVLNSPAPTSYYYSSYR